MYLLVTLKFKYLGTDLEEVTAGQNVFDEMSIVENIPLLPIPHFVLMPNQILPLNKFHPQLVSMFRVIIANSRCFGVVNAPMQGYHWWIRD